MADSPTVLLEMIRSLLISGKSCTLKLTGGRTLQGCFERPLPNLSYQFFSYSKDGGAGLSVVTVALFDIIAIECKKRDYQAWLVSVSAKSKERKRTKHVRQAPQAPQAPQTGRLAAPLKTALEE